MTGNHFLLFFLAHMKLEFFKVIYMFCAEQWSVAVVCITPYRLPSFNWIIFCQLSHFFILFKFVLWPNGSRNYLTGTEQHVKDKNTEKEIKRTKLKVGQQQRKKHASQSLKTFSISLRRQSYRDEVCCFGAVLLCNKSPPLLPHSPWIPSPSTLSPIFLTRDL